MLRDEEALIALNELAPELIQWLKKLPEEYIRPCELLYAEKKTIEETAAELKISIADVAEYVIVVAALLHERLEGRVDLEALSRVFPGHDPLAWFLPRH